MYLLGARTQLCFTSLVTANGWEYLLSSYTLAFMPSWNCLTIAINLGRGGGGQRKFAMIALKPSRDIVSNDLDLWRWYTERHFVLDIFLVIGVLSIPYLQCCFSPARKPHWPSGIRSRSRCALRRFSMMRARILPTMESMDMPWWLSQTFLFLLRFQRWMMEASLSACGSVPWVHMELSLLDFRSIWGPPAAYTSVEIESAQGALPLDIAWWLW